LENVLLSRDGQTCKIIDYGMSLRFARDPTGAAMAFPPQGVCGKKYYIAPEVMQNTDPFHGHLADIWALGVVLFLLVVGAPPVEFASPACDRFLRVAAGEMWDMVGEWGVTYVSPQARDLISLILRVDPANRPSLQDIQAHPWMNPGTTG
jgi:serine/threonine protein kinase